MELRDRSHAVVVVQHSLFHNPRHTTIVLGRGTQARSIPDGEFLKSHFSSACAHRLIHSILQFANLETGEDSADVENSFQ